MLVSDIRIRDVFVLPVAQEGRYYLYGSTDTDTWSGPGVGFDAYVTTDLVHAQGPFPVFRPQPGFWADRHFWAPEVHAYRGRYYMLAYFKSGDACRGTQVLAADHPAGPFLPLSDRPVTPGEWECLDGTLYQEAGQNYLVFCREWVQTGDGEMYAMPLDEELNRAGDPILLFTASNAPWARPSFPQKDGHEVTAYVTDGPFLHHTQDGALLMLWSTFGEDGYVQGYSRSLSGSITGPWAAEDLLYSRDGGHGMLFRTLDGRLTLALHSPNSTGAERLLLLPVSENGGRLAVEK